VNRNKRVDEQIKKHGIGVSMIFLTAAVTIFLLGITHRYRHTHTQSPMSPEDKFRALETQRILEKAPKD
jgi:hypothetical protein